MTEYGENRIVENQEVVVGDYPGIESIKEYWDETRPEYKWNTNDNLLACLQFSKFQPFPELVFQKFIVKNWYQARDSNKPTEQPQEQVEDVQFELPIEELSINIEITSEDSSEEPIHGE